MSTTKFNVTALLEQAQQASDAGFTAAGKELLGKAQLATKLATAYEHYRYVSQEQVEEFKRKLKAKTERPATDEDRRRLRENYATKVCDTLKFVPMSSYVGLPPADVFEKVKEARARECFDGLMVAEVAPMASEVKLPDPIVFGHVNGCTDLFYIAEWGTDVSINDLLAPNEG